MFDKILGRIREGGNEGGGGGGTPKTITVHDITDLLGELTDAQMDDLHVGDIIYDDEINTFRVGTWWFVVSKDYYDYQYYLRLVRLGIAMPSDYNTVKESWLYFDMREYIRLVTPVEGRYWKDAGMARKDFALTHSWNKAMDALVRFDWVENASFWKNGDFVQATDGLYLIVGSKGDPTRRFVKVDAESVTEVIYKYAHSTVYYDYYETRTTYLRNYVSISYDELKKNRDSMALTPGRWYRITDYSCTTTQQNTQSAGHQFDILVRADDKSHLNENAFAMHHDGDTYFQNCKLDAWELKYCLDNDTNRFAWADDENGKGVVYLMKDEWNNECPYDFKNIMFKRWAVTECDSCPDLVVDGEDNPYGYYYGAMQLDGESQVLENATYGEDSGWFYTFALKDLASDEWYDYTVVAHLGLKNDEGIEAACYDNHIVEGTDECNSGKGEMAKMLNNIVFFNCYTDPSDTSYADDYSYCNNNRFLGNCHSNTFGNNCSYNSFGNGCTNNTFGNYCYSNSFGNYCYNNTFGNNFYQNTVGNVFQDNSFGNDCRYNSFGNDCSDNTFGNNCYSNSFGNDCFNNSFGNYCYSNSFGNYCYRNSFGNYCQTITVFDGVQNCSVTGGTQQAPVKNAQILNGTAGASAQNKLTIAFAANKAYTQVAAKNTAGNLKIWNPADLVQ